MGTKGSFPTALECVAPLPYVTGRPQQTAKKCIARFFFTNMGRLTSTASWAAFLGFFGQGTLCFLKCNKGFSIMIGDHYDMLVILIPLKTFSRITISPDLYYSPLLTKVKKPGLGKELQEKKSPDHFLNYKAFLRATGLWARIHGTFWRVSPQLVHG